MIVAISLAAIVLASVVIYGTLKVVQACMFHEFLVKLIDLGYVVDINHSYNNLSRSVAWNYNFSDMIEYVE